MEKQIETAVKRGRAYWFVDGFAEMGAGILFLLLGIGVLLRGWIGREGFLSWFASAAIDIGIFKAVAILTAILAVWWLKDRFTYPRTGYVRGNRVPPVVILTFLRNVFLIVVLPVLMLMAAIVFLPPVRVILASIPAWLPMGIGILWGVFSYLAGEWMGLRRFRLMGLLILLAGVAVGIWQLLQGFPAFPSEALDTDWLAVVPGTLQAPLMEILGRLFLGIGSLTLIAGVFLLISGLTTFLHYRKENPTPYREEA
jgi:hypothetical protein